MKRNITATIIDFREATMDDLDELVQVNHKLSNESPWVKREMSLKDRVEYEKKQIATFTSENYHYFLLVIDGSIVGVSRYQAKTKITGMLCIAILQDYQGQGYGKRMLSYVLDTLEEYGDLYVELSVSMKNTVARNLYLSMGFKDVRTTASKDDPHVLMRKYLR